MTAERSIVSVVAGGWSMADVDPRKIPGFVIAVNDSAIHLAEAGRMPDEVVSMDRLWTEARWKWMCDRAGTAYIRSSVCKNVDFVGKEWLILFKNDNTSAKFGDQPTILNGTNSGYCALNRAYHIKPDQLYLFGFDFCLGPKGQRRWYDQEWGPPDGSMSGYHPIPWRNEIENHAAFAFADAGIKTINVSTRSIIRIFPKRDPRELGFAREKGGA